MSGTRSLSRTAPVIDRQAKPHLLVVAHGERGGAGDDRFARAVAARVASSARYASIGTCFISKEPSLQNVFADLPSGPVVIYPLFMSDGYFVRKAIPRSIGLLSQCEAQGGRLVTIMQPAGLNRRLPGIVADLARTAAETAGLDAASCRLLLIAHGSRHDDASRRATLSVAGAFENTQQFAAVSCGFLEEQPFVDQQLNTIAGPVIAVGLFAGEGMHASDDVVEAIQNAGRPDVFLSPPLTLSPGLFNMVCHDLDGAAAQIL